MNSEIPPMQPLAPIVDQMREIARDELPEPQSCRIQLWDDGTFDLEIYHSPGPDSRQTIRYESATSEIYWEHASGAGWEVTEFPNGEELREPTMEEWEVKVITTVEPPYQ